MRRPCQKKVGAHRHLTASLAISHGLIVKGLGFTKGFRVSGLGIDLDDWE